MLTYHIALVRELTPDIGRYKTRIHCYISPTPQYISDWNTELFPQFLNVFSAILEENAPYTAIDIPSFRTFLKKSYKLKR